MLKWSVGAKIGSGFSLALLILLVLGVVSYHSTGQLTDTAHRVALSHQVLEELSGVTQAIADAETGQRGYIITGVDSYLEPYDAGLAVLDQHLARLRELTANNPEHQRRLKDLEPSLRARMAALARGVELRRSGDVEGARQFIASGAGKKEMDVVRSSIADFRGSEMTMLKERSDLAEAAAARTRWTIIVGTVMAFALLAVVGYLITRSISRPLQAITATAEQIAAGDLTASLASHSRTDEVGALATAFARMTDSLQRMAGTARRIASGDLRVKVEPMSDRDVLGSAFATMVENLRTLTGNIAQGANLLNASAAEIVAASTQLASGSAQTATALAETTTTVEEVRQTAQVASQKARAVSDSAQAAAVTAQAGLRSTEETSAGMVRIREQMDSIAQSMVRLSEQTQAIGQIIATVDDLAQQSNLLAVNASIEAAKAGEQGKGFVVVAQEVRSLAEQSKAATTQVRSILHDIQKATAAAVMATEQGTKAVEAGALQSQKSGESIRALAEASTDAAQAATQIAASSQQQFAGMDQVAMAMESIKQASAQNVDSAKQLEDAARSLESLGRNLREMMARFEV